MPTWPSFPARRWPPAAPLALALIVTAGACLRLYGLDAESVWLDEAFAIGTARAGIDAVIYETRLDVHPPLYYFVLAGWTRLAGASAWSARLLSVLFSLGILVATARIGTRLSGRTTGLLAAVLLAVSVFHIEFAQEARMYSLLALLATLSMRAFIEVIETPRLAWFVAYAAATSLMTYTHVYAFFVIAAQGATVAVDLAWRRREGLESAARWVAAQALVFAAFLPWLPTFTWQVSLVQTGFWIGEPEPFGFIDAFRTYTGSEPLLWGWLVAGAIGSIGLTGRPRTERQSRPALLFVLPWLAGPVLLPFTLSLYSAPIFLPKYTIAASVPFALLAAAGISRLPHKVIAATAAITCVVLSVSTLPGYYTRHTKDGWRDAVPVVESLAAPADAVVVYPYFNKIAYEYYRDRTDLQVRALPLFGAPPPGDGWPRVLERATAGRDRIWLVTLQADPTSRVVIEELRRDYVVAWHEVRQKVAIHRFDRRP